MGMARQVRQLKVKDGFVRNAMEGSLSESSRWSGGTRMIASLLERTGPDWLVPDFGTLYRQKTLTVHVPLPPRHRRAASLDRQHRPEIRRRW
jgi:hypothetical protein